MKTELIHGGLFEGIGAFSLGARKAGIKTIYFSELLSYRQNILNQHFKNTKLYGKIQTIQNPPYVDILTGGFPCQDISLAGSAVGIIGDRSSLWSEYFRIIETSRPRYVVIENSPQLLNAGMDMVLYDLSTIGYDAQWTTLQANWFGFRHIRKRTFIIAYPMQKRYERVVNIFGIIPKVLQQNQDAKQANLSMLLKRFDRHTDKRDLRANAGFSKGLDKNTIEAIGDSLNVEIAHYLFECIKIHYAAHTSGAL